VPTAAKPGRVVGSVLPCESGRNVKDSYDARMFYRNAVLPQQTATTPHCFFRTNSVMQDKPATFESEKHNAQAKQQPAAHCNMAAKAAPGMIVDMNANPYYQPPANVEQLNERIAIDAKLIQAQSQFGVVGAAAVAVAAHRNVGAVQYGLSS